MLDVAVPEAPCWSSAPAPPSSATLGGEAPAIGMPPGIPGIDSHVSRKSLHYKALSDHVRRSRWSSVGTKGRRKTRSVLERSSPSREDEHVPRDERTKKIYSTCRYIDLNYGNGDGEVSQLELERVFRSMRRAGAEKLAREKGRALVRRLDVLMKRRGVSLEDFMRDFDVSRDGRGDGKLSRLELRSALDRLADADHRLISAETSSKQMPDYNSPSCLATRKHAQEMKRRDRKDSETLISRELEAVTQEAGYYLENSASAQNARGILRFSESDLTDLIRYLDPNADGELTMSELHDGLRRKYDEESSTSLMTSPTVKSDDEMLRDAAFEILGTFETEMKKSGLRISDVFRAMDRDGSGSVSVAELQATLDKICGSSSERAAYKLKSDKLDRLNADRARKDSAEDARRARIKAAEAARVPEALAHLSMLLRRRDFRLVDLFSKTTGFDTSGDGRLDATELQAILIDSGLKLKRKEVSALLAFFDTSGDGKIDAHELSSAVRQHRRDNIEETEKRQLNFGAASALLKQPRVLKVPPFRCKKYIPPALDPIGYDPAWLKSLDVLFAKHTGPQPKELLFKYTATASPR